MSKILITGATGALGSAVVKELVNRHGTDNIAVLVRNLPKSHDMHERGIRRIEGDYNDYSSLVKAFIGIDKLYFVSSNDIAHRHVQHENVVNAAIAARVGHIIYTSFQRKTEDDSSPISFVASAHLLAEKLILESGLVYTILKHALYAEVLPRFMGDQVIDAGMIFLPAGNGKASFTSRADMAHAGVAVLTGEGHEKKTYEIAVDRSYSFYDIADILSKLSGKPVQYAAPHVDTFTTALTHAGVPQENIQAMTSFCTAIAKGEFDFPDTTLEKLIGQKPQSLEEFLKDAYKL